MAYKPRWNQKDAKLTIDRVAVLNGEPVTYDKSLEIEVKGFTHKEVQALIVGLRLGLELSKSGKLDTNLIDKLSKLVKVQPASNDSKQPPNRELNNQNDALGGSGQSRQEIPDVPSATPDITEGQAE